MAEESHDASVCDCLDCENRRAAAQSHTDAKEAVDDAFHEAAINAKAWEIFLRYMEAATLDNLGEDDEETQARARKRITAIACNALEAAEIFVKTVEE